MTIQVKYTYDNGNKPLGIFDSQGAQVAVLRKPGDEYTATVYDGVQFNAREIGEDVLPAGATVGPTPAAPNPDADPVTAEFERANAAHGTRKLPGERE